MGATGGAAGVAPRGAALDDVKSAGALGCIGSVIVQAAGCQAVGSALLAAASGAAGVVGADTASAAVAP